MENPVTLLSDAIFEYRNSHKGDAPNEVFVNSNFRNDLINCIEKLYGINTSDVDGKERFAGVIIVQREQAEPISFHRIWKANTGSNT